MSDSCNWQPTASIEHLKLRARMLSDIRAFFAAREVWEVETPVLSSAATTDPHIQSFKTKFAGLDYYLHTSPEFAMKRLLSAGSGSIYQLCKVYRDEELGKIHNPEFTLLEWYRVGFDDQQLIQEIDDLIRDLLEAALPLKPTCRFTYAEAFETYAGLNPFTADITQLESCLEGKGYEFVGMDNESRDTWLDLIMTHIIEPALPKDTPVFIFNYPASQASLARLDESNTQVARRFELYLNGMELANGFYELTDAGMQQQRFESDIAKRKQAGLTEVPYDKKLVSALKNGLPDCAGVALGIDRVFMLLAGLSSIEQAISFTIQKA